jgi:glycosyltransferase involved in cell wall biosynthesis
MALPFEVTLYAPAPLAPGLLPADHSFSVRVIGSRVHPAVWTHWQLARTAGREADVLLSPAYVAPLTYRGRLLVVVHDVLQELLPSTLPGRWPRAQAALYRRSARRADLVLTVSQSSKADIERLYRIPAARIRAIPLAADDSFRVFAADTSGVRRRYGLEGRPFVLFVGKLSLRRNLLNLVRAFAEARRRASPSACLVVVGPHTHPLPLEELGAELGLGDSLRVLGYVSEEDLRPLYREAEVFVYPSEYEGFGLPVLEAMASGTAVITLDNSALREVAGDAAWLLPSADVEGLAGAMAALLSDPELRLRYVERGLQRAAQFSWRRTAEETMAAVVEVAA